MGKTNYRDKALFGFIWSFLERCGAQGVTFIVSILLARILDPSVYGVVAIVNVVTALLAVFINKGLSSALIQKKNPDDLDFSSMFYFNFLLSIVLYSMVFILAKYIADFYNMPELTALIRVASLELVVAGVKSVQYAYVSKHMQFKKFFYSTLSGTIGAAVLGIYMAYSGFGVWALVVQSLFNTTVGTIILWFTTKWRPKLMFSFSRIKSLFSYGWKILVASLIDTGYERLRQLIIGKMYTAEDLAFYNKGQAYPSLLVSNITDGINGVLLPSMSAVQDNTENIRNMTRRAIKIGSYTVMPIMAGLAACASPLVEIVFTEKWLPCIPFLRIFCVMYAFYPMHTANLNAIKALGRSGMFLKLEIIKKAIGVVAILVSMWYGSLALAYSMLFVTLVGTVINAWPNVKLLQYSYFKQIKDIAPIILLSSFMAACVYSIEFLNMGIGLTLIVQIVLGILVYVLGSIIFRIDSFGYIFDILKGLLHKNKGSE